MKNRKACLLICAAAFVLMLALPILAINRIPGRVSTTENRYLATFPVVFDKEGHLNADLKSGVETWLSDNIGFRSLFVKIAANIRLKVFHQSTNSQVEIGRDGWYFYTSENNIRLASGEYVLTDEMLADIADKQQRISNWYASRGIKYLLVLTPAKMTVYPEYIASGDYGIRETLCDQLEEYLSGNTTVQVVNCKRTLLENKSSGGGGQLFYKHDTHVTQLGEYYSYLAIAQKLNAMGNRTQELSVAFSQMVVETGDLARMLGMPDVLGPETVPQAQWQSDLIQIDSGTEFDALTLIRQNDAGARGYPLQFYENSEAENGTLLIYGDSIWWKSTCLTKWVGSGYKRAVTMALRSINAELEDLVQPDTVIYSCGERMIGSLLTRPVNVPYVVDSLPDLPWTDMITVEKYGGWVANQGMCVDTYNEKHLERSTDIQVDPAASSVTLYGWAADFRNDAPFKELYLQVGDMLLRCDYGIERVSVAQAFGKDSLLKTGFRVTFPASYLMDGQVTEVSFVGVSADGQSLYEPVTYTLGYM